MLIFENAFLTTIEMIISAVVVISIVVATGLQNLPGLIFLR